MEVTNSIDLSSVIVSVASAVVEANRILSEGTEAPMGISEFAIRYQVHASLHLPLVGDGRRGISVTEHGIPMVERIGVRPAQLRNITTLTPKERILTGYLREADLTITTKIEPLPRLE